MNHKESYILNLFFGEIINEPISFSHKFTELKDIHGNDALITFELFNSDWHFPIEQEFANFNSIANKQNVGHNFQACAETGIVRIIYPDFKSEHSYIYTEQVNMFLQSFIAYLLTFFQRRRVILGCPKLTSGELTILAMPPFLAGELIDSIGYGSPSIAYERTKVCLNNALKTYSESEENDQKHIEMLLTRYNETLNLPYTYERVESYWRILEALGHTSEVSDEILNEYNRIKNLLGMRNNSKTLKKFITTLFNYGIVYTDDNVINSFNYRNLLTHEYLNQHTISKEYLSEIFRFLNQSIEFVLLKKLGINRSEHNSENYTLIQNRIL